MDAGARASTGYGHLHREEEHVSEHKWDGWRRLPLGWWVDTLRGDGWSLVVRTHDDGRTRLDFFRVGFVGVDFDLRGEVLRHASERATVARA